MKPTLRGRFRFCAHHGPFRFPV